MFKQNSIDFEEECCLDQNTKGAEITYTRKITSGYVAVQTVRKLGSSVLLRILIFLVYHV